MADATAKGIADALLCFGSRHGDPITNLKLQKLVYYAQAWWLALNDRPLFDDRLEAWIHGPVQPGVYHQFKGYGGNPILLDYGSGVSLGIGKHLVDVWRAYGRFSAFELEELTHSELPWQNARAGLPIDAPSTNEISHDDMKTFYRGKLGGQA